MVAESRLGTQGTPGLGELAPHDESHDHVLCELEGVELPPPPGSYSAPHDNDRAMYIFVLCTCRHTPYSR